MLDFPNSPAPSQVFSDPSGASWYWDGAKWSAMGTSTEGWPFLPLSGGALTGALTLVGNAAMPLQPVTLQQMNMGLAPLQQTISFVNVLDHGAKGDGVTDDTAAIQGVINTYAGKATVFIPDTGHPYIAAALTILTGTDLLIHGTVLAKPNSGTLLYIQNVSNVTVRGHGTLDGNGTNQASGPQAVFYAFQSTNVQLSGLTLQNSFDWNLNVVTCTNVIVNSVRLLGGNTSNEFAVGCNHCWITNSYINGVLADESFSFYSGCTNCGIANCEVSNGFISGISVYADAAGGNVAPCSHINIANNIVHNCGEGGIEVRTGDAGPPVNHTNITITGNRCYSNANRANTYFGEIWLESGSNITITGNALSNTGSGNAGSVGILVGSATSDITITGNSIWNIGQGSTIGVGIFLQRAPNVLVEGNHIYDNQTTPTMVAAFSGAAGASNTIVGNMYNGVPSGLGYGTNGCGLATDTIVASVVDGVWTVGAPTGGVTTSVLSGSPGFTTRLLYQTNKAPVWSVGLDGAAQSGGNQGANYIIAPYNDAHALQPAALSISRANGSVTFPSSATFGLGTSGGDTDVVINGAVAHNRVVAYETAGFGRWNVGVNGNPETGSNVGSDFFIACYTDSTGALLHIPLSINRATGVVTLNVAPTIATLPTNATDDAAAATAGVAVGGVYRNGSVMQVRVT